MYSYTLGSYYTYNQEPITKRNMFHQAAPKNKWDWGFMEKKRTGWRAEIFLFYFIFYFSDSVCIYVYILEGHWDARHVRPLTFNTHIFCQCNSM